MTIKVVSYARTGPIEKGKWEFVVTLDGGSATTIWSERNDWPCLEECTHEQVEKWFLDAYGWAVSLICFGVMQR